MKHGPNRISHPPRAEKERKETHHAPNIERIPQANQTTKERPTLPEFFSTPWGEMNIPLPTMLPMRSEKALKRVIFFLRKTASSFFFDFPMACAVLWKSLQVSKICGAEV